MNEREVIYMDMKEKVNFIHKRKESDIIGTNTRIWLSNATIVVATTAMTAMLALLKSSKTSIIFLKQTTLAWHWYQFEPTA